MIIRILPLLALLVLVPLGLDARQDAPDPQAPLPEDPDTVQLVFEREVFNYPSHVRRNPFRPLTGVSDAGPRFEELRLLGVIVSSEPGGSVALVGVAGTTEPGAATQRLRVGQTLGNIRVLEIRPREMDVEVEEFGLRERVTMRLQRTAPEAAGDPGTDPPPPDPDDDDDDGDGDGDGGETDEEDGD